MKKHVEAVIKIKLIKLKDFSLKIPVVSCSSPSSWKYDEELIHYGEITDICLEFHSEASLIQSIVYTLRGARPRLG